MRIKNNGLINDKYELIVKEFQTIITVLYLLLIGIGMIFSYSKYSQFGINIFQYSDAFDFLLTPFRDITIFLFSFITILLVYLVFILNKFTKKKFSKFYNSKFYFGLNKSYPILSIFVSFVLYLYIFSGGYGRLSKKRMIENPNNVEIILTNGKIKKGNLIGKNNGYVFLLENNNVNIYPIASSISLIKINSYE